MKFRDVLAEFKGMEEENVENISPLADDSNLRNGLIAWKSVSVTVKNEGECEAEGESERWNWLWRQVAYDLQTFGNVAGVRAQDVGPLINRLVGLRLIYPDGTINGMAKQLLQAFILSKIKGPRVGRPKKEKPPG